MVTVDSGKTPVSGDTLTLSAVDPSTGATCGNFTSISDPTGQTGNQGATDADGTITATLNVESVTVQTDCDIEAVEQETAPGTGSDGDTMRAAAKAAYGAYHCPGTGVHHRDAVAVRDIDALRRAIKHHVVPPVRGTQRDGFRKPVEGCALRRDEARDEQRKRQYKKGAIQVGHNWYWLAEVVIIPLSLPSTHATDLVRPLTALHARNAPRGGAHKVDASFPLRDAGISARRRMFRALHIRIMLRSEAQVCCCFVAPKRRRWLW